MLSDEEKKAIEIIKFLQDKCIIENETGMMSIYRLDDLAKAIEILLNLIEKQSKEIEELKDKNKTLKNLQNDTNRLYIEMIERKNYFEGKLQKLEDKIKAKIEVLEKLQKEFPNNDEIRIKIIAYKELLEKE